MVVEVNPVYYDVPWEHLSAAMDAQLSQLDIAGTALVGAVSQRTIEYQHRAADIKRRLEIARTKIDQIAKAKQGIVIYSPGTYPVPKEKQNETFKRLFPESPFVSAPTLENIHRPLTSGHTKLKEGLQFLDVSSTSGDTDILRLTPRGLGSIRKRNLRNVADLLVFNTTINPYSVEPLADNTDSRKPDEDEAELDVTQDNGGSEHNSSLTLPALKDLAHFDGDSLEYQPGASSIPELLLPSDLPLLDAFVTDLPDLLPNAMIDGPRSSSRNQRPLPPLAGEDNLPTLPDISDDALTVASFSAAPTTISSPVATSSAVPSAVPPPPPPAPPGPGPSSVPPPPPPLPSQSLHSSPSAGGGPPPPPPPPAPSSSGPPQETATKAKIPAPVGDRSSLLEAIRNSKGIAGLRERASKSVPKRPTPKKPAASGAAPVLDHMDALKARLNQRRRDIGGEGRSAASQPDVTKGSEKAGLIGGLMNKITNQSAGSDSEDVGGDDDGSWSD